MKRLIQFPIQLIMLIFILICCFLFNSEAHSQLLPDTARTRIYIAKTILGSGIDTTLFTASKVQPAMHLITRMCPKYQMVTDNEIIDAIKTLPQNYNAFDIAKAVRANRIYIIKIEELMNIIRTEITSVSPNKTDSIVSSEGFAALHILKKQLGTPVYDPTLLTALQRAFAVAEGDTNMFSSQIEPYNVKPVPNLVIAGFQFINDTNLLHFNIFDNPVVSSYEFLEIIYEQVRTSNDYLTFDTDSRDALYALFQLLLPENSNLPSYNELAALNRFGIHHYVTGKIERNHYGITITLYINELNNAITKIVKECSTTINKNDVPLTLNSLKKLTLELISANQ